MAASLVEEKHTGDSIDLHMMYSETHLITNTIGTSKLVLLIETSIFVGSFNIIKYQEKCPL